MVPWVWTRRKALVAAAWGLTVLSTEIFLILMYRSIMSTFTFYSAIAAAVISSTLISLAIYISEPRFKRARYKLIIDVLDERVDDDLGRMIINMAKERGHVSPYELAKQANLSIYKVVERIHELEKEGKLRISGLMLE